MTSNPWDKFYWNDWENDPALKLCSFAAQGLWMRCLCICAKADPKGYLLVAGRPLGATDLARLTGAPETEVESLLSELARNGVFSRDRTGRIFNRRMVADARKHRNAVENGRKGGNPSLRKDKEIPPSVNPTHNAEDKTHKPEARVQKESGMKVGSLPPIQKSPPSGAPRAPPEKAGLVFVGKVVRLNATDFEAWRQRFKHIPDYLAVLAKADAYYADHPPPDGKWFFPVSSFLERENRRHLETKQAAMKPTKPVERWAM